LGKYLTGTAHRVDETQIEPVTPRQKILAFSEFFRRGPRGKPAEHNGPQRHNSRNVHGLKRIALVANSGKVHHKVGPLNPHVGLGDPSGLKLVANQIANNDQIIF
jgi:hypothetical protein